MIVLKIPVKSYVKKYLIARYGRHHTISRSSLLGLMVYDHLTKNFSPKQSVRHSLEVYEVELTEWCFKNVGHSIDVATLDALGNALYYLFREDMYLYVRNEIVRGCMATTAIKNFLNAYSITEDELKFETVYRDYRRKHRPIKADRANKTIVTS